MCKTSRAYKKEKLRWGGKKLLQKKNCSSGGDGGAFEGGLRYAKKEQAVTRGSRLIFNSRKAHSFRGFPVSHTAPETVRPSERVLAENVKKISRSTWGTKWKKGAV